MVACLPSAESLAHRANLASLITKLRPTHFRTHLTKLPAHRVPTLWTLYRGLLRDAPNDTVIREMSSDEFCVKIRLRMRVFFQQRKSMRIQGNITRELRKAYKWWDIFKKARSGDVHFQAVCERYSRMIQGTMRQHRANAVYDEELAWIERMRTRAIMTGGYLKPTLWNGPLPRLLPQPMHITGMIMRRRLTHANRVAKWVMYEEYKEFLKIEQRFEAQLGRAVRQDGASFEGVFSDLNSWHRPLQSVIDTMNESATLERARALKPYPPALLEQVKEARREKIRNKTREREREARGEMTTRLARAMRQRPPPHVIARMSPRERRLDAIARGASEVGYVAEVKRQLGYKLKDPHKWEVELGSPENREALDKMAEEIEVENAKRRVAADGLGGTGEATDTVSSFA